MKSYNLAFQRTARAKPLPKVGARVSLIGFKKLGVALAAPDRRRSVLHGIAKYALVDYWKKMGRFLPSCR